MELAKRNYELVTGKTFSYSDLEHIYDGLTEKEKIRLDEEIYEDLLILEEEVEGNLSKINKKMSKDDFNRLIDSATEVDLRIFL